MRRMMVSLIGLALTGVLLLPAASAASVHLVDGPDFSADDGSLVSSGSIAGLGNEDVTIEVDATALLTCENRGGNKPPGQSDDVSGMQTIEDPTNGRVNFTVVTGQVSDPCPGPMEPDVTFTDAMITVIQGGEIVLQESYDLQA